MEELKQVKSRDHIQYLLEKVATHNNTTLGGENACFKLNQIWKIQPNQSLEWQEKQFQEISIQDYVSYLYMGVRFAYEMDANLISIINMHFVLEKELHSQVYIFKCKINDIFRL